MKVYHESPNMMVIAQPGNDFPDNSDWKDSEGNAILFQVQFKNGEAQVPSGLGRYMIDNKLAKRSPLILPNG